MAVLTRRGAPGDGAAPAGSTWRTVGRSAGARLLVLPVSAVLGIVITRLVVQNYGPAAFAQYGLLVGIAALLPFADLGISAPLMNGVAASPDPSTDEHVRRLLTTAIRILVLSASVLLTVTLLLTLTGSWDGVLGAGLVPRSGSRAAAACVALIAVTLPFGIGQRVLAGLGKNHVSIALLGLQSPIVLLVLLVLIASQARAGSVVPVVAYAATLLIAVLSTVLAARRIRPVLGQALRAAPRLRTHRGARIFDVAGPMLVVMVALPVSLQTDRLVLSHVAGVQSLARYNIAAQMYTPVWQVVSAAGFALWPIYARARATSRSSSPVPTAAVFGAAAALVCLVVSLAGPWLADVATDGRVHLDLPIRLSFSALMVLQAFQYPLGMYLTDRAGLRHQARMLALMAPVNLGLSWYLATVVGAAGPVIGSAVGILVFQVVANLGYVRRGRRREPAPPTRPDSVTAAS